MGVKANRWPASAETRTQCYPRALGELKLSDIQVMEIPTLGGLAQGALTPSSALECERWTALFEDSNLDDAETLIPCGALRARHSPRRVVRKRSCARGLVRISAVGRSSRCCSSRLE